MPTKIGATELRRAFYRLDHLGRRVWTLVKLARKAGISKSHTGSIINGQWRRDTKARRAVVKVLGLD